MSGPFSYTDERLKAGEIRLLHIYRSLVPQENGDAIPQCKFERRRLSDPELQYQALSYAWGDPSDTQPILVNGKVKNVTLNLRAFLDQFIKADGQFGSDVEPWCLLWVDAICINQADGKEKSVQVGQMAQIYSRAARVVVWLGRESEDSGLAMTALSDISDAIHANPKWLDENPLYPGPFFSSVLRTLDDPKTTVALSSFLERQWFWRAWVRQEVILAKQNTALIVCGERTLLWFDILGSVATIGHLVLLSVSRNRDFRDLVFPALRLTRFFLFVREPQPLHELLRQDLTYATAEASLPVDYIYSLLGLAQPEEQWTEIFKPDYSRPFHQVLIEIGHYLYATIGVQTLSWCHYHDAPALPSWVPDWSFRNTGIAGRRSKDTDQSKYCASDSRDSFTYAIAGPLLHVDGISIGSVRPHVHSAERHSLNGDYSCVACREIESEFYTFLCEYAGERFLDSNALRSRKDAARPESDKTSLVRQLDHLWLKHGFHNAETSQHEGVRSELGVLGRYFSNMANITTGPEGRAYIALSGGAVGTAPGVTRPDDKLYIIKGVDTPVILRQTADDHFLYIGEAYFYGMMNGEAVANGAQFKRIALV